VIYNPNSIINIKYGKRIAILATNGFEEGLFTKRIFRATRMELKLLV
jgi:hypothetical protein